MRPQFRKLPFAKIRETLEQLLGRDHSQHGITQELELLVVTHPEFARIALQCLPLPSLGRVSERLLDQLRPLEMMSERGFQDRYFACLHFRMRHRTSGASKGGCNVILTGARPQVARWLSNYFCGGCVAAPLVPEGDFAGGMLPPVSCTSRSRSLRARPPTDVFSCVISTALLASCRASGYLFCLSRESARRSTTTGSGC